MIPSGSLYAGLYRGRTEAGLVSPSSLPRFCLPFPPLARP
jgi:hypothetical protein